MSFKKASQVRLVGEIQLVGNILQQYVRGFQQQFDFQYGKMVDDGFRRFAGDVAADIGEILGGNTQCVGIKCHFALQGAMRVDQIDEFAEQFSLAVGAFDFLARVPAVDFVTGVQQKIMQHIPGNLVAEVVFTVGVDCDGCFQHAFNRICCAFGHDVVGMVFQKMKKAGIHSEGCFPEHAGRADKIREEEIPAFFGNVHDAVETDDYGVFTEGITFQIYGHQSFTLPAKEYGNTSYFVQTFVYGLLWVITGNEWLFV